MWCDRLLRSATPQPFTRSLKHTIISIWIVCFMDYRYFLHHQEEGKLIRLNMLLPNTVVPGFDCSMHFIPSGQFQFSSKMDDGVIFFGELPNQLKGLTWQPFLGILFEHLSYFQVSTTPLKMGALCIEFMVPIFKWIAVTWLKHRVAGK